jgi:molybdopterin synthase sulfur carrier subunit
MDVEVSLFESLKDRRPEGGRVTLPTGARVSDLLAALGIAVADVGILMVNREDGRFDQELRDGDRVTVIPPIGGG